MEAFIAQLFPETEKVEIDRLIKDHGYDRAIGLLCGDIEEQDDIMALKTLFPNVDENLLVDTFLACNDIDETINRLSGYLDRPDDLKSDELVMVPDSIQQVCQMFPNLHHRSIENFFESCGGNVEQTIDVLVRLDCNPRENRVEQLSTLQTILPHVPQQELAFQLSKLKTIDAVIDSFLVPSPQAPLDYSQIKGPEPILQFSSGYQPLKENTTTTLTATTSTLAEDVEYWRGLAHQAYLQRNEFYQKAAQAYKRGQLTGKGTAAHYAEQGKSYDQKMKEYNSKAAYAIIRLQSQKNEANVVDLHGLTIQEAKSFLEQYTKHQNGRLKIITGAGHHSSGGSVLFPAIYNYFKNRGWKLEYGCNGWFYCKP